MNTPEYQKKVNAERAVLEELKNICLNYPLFAGNTLSHRTANECVERGWAERNKHGDFLPSSAGLGIYNILRPKG